MDFLDISNFKEKPLNKLINTKRYMKKVQPSKQS